MRFLCGPVLVNLVIKDNLVLRAVPVGELGIGDLTDHSASPVSCGVAVLRRFLHQRSQQEILFLR